MKAIGLVLLNLILVGCFLPLYALILGVPIVLIFDDRAQGPLTVVTVGLSVLTALLIVGRVMKWTAPKKERLADTRPLSPRGGEVDRECAADA